MDPCISIIIPVYKVEEYLDHCVKSVTEQSFAAIEIILVDDGSPDNCPAMCDAWAERDSRVRVIHKTNGGLSDARNAGLAAARGKLIFFLDSDDWLAPETLEKLFAAMQHDRSDIAACTVKMVWDDGTPERFLTVQQNLLLDTEEAEKALMNETFLKQPVWYKLYRSDCIREIPFEVGKQHEDVFWSYQAFANARLVSVIDYVGYYYRQRAGSIMGTSYSLKRLDAIEAYQRRSRFMEERFPALAGYSRASLVAACIYHGQMALKYLPEAERREAFRRLIPAVRESAVSYRDYSSRKLTARLWIGMARMCLPLVCWVKKTLGVGF